MRLSSSVLAICLVSWAIGSSATAAEAAPPLASAPAGKRLSDSQIKQLLIEESIAAYPGSCPCPYSTARNGTRCGKRSAYDRKGGAAPLCYARDVTAELVAAYRAEHPDQ